MSKTEIYYEEQNKEKFNKMTNINNKLNLTQKTFIARPESSYKNKSMNNTFNYSIRNNSSLSFN